MPDANDSELLIFDQETLKKLVAEPPNGAALVALDEKLKEFERRREKLLRASSAQIAHGDEEPLVK